MAENTFSELFELRKTRQSIPSAPGEESDGECYGGGRGRKVTTLSVRYADKPWESFQYGYIGLRGQFEPTRFVIPFASPGESYHLVVKGRGLFVVYDRLINGRLGWICPSLRPGFAPDGEAVITHIDIVKLDTP